MKKGNMIIYTCFPRLFLFKFTVLFLLPFGSFVKPYLYLISFRFSLTCLCFPPPVRLLKLHDDRHHQDPYYFYFFIIWLNEMKFDDPPPRLYLTHPPVFLPWLFLPKTKAGKQRYGEMIKVLCKKCIRIEVKLKAPFSISSPSPFFYCHFK